MTVSDSALELPAQQVEELIRTIVKALRAFQMYLPNNPIYQRSVDSLRSAFNPIWAGVPELVLTIAETDLIWQDQVVYHQESRSESFAWMLYKDGMRQLTLRPDCERDEVVLLLQTVVRARLLAIDAGDDLLTLLWEHDFAHIDYRFAEIITDTLMVLDPHAAEMSGADPFRQVETQQKIRQELGSFAPGMVDDFDSTLYFLDEAEIRALKEQVEKEYQSDVRTSALAAMLDIFELQGSAEVRGEVIEILESVFPNLLNRGEFRIVAWLLRELRLVASRAGLVDDTVRRRLDSFETRLSESGILGQMLEVVDQAAGIVEDDDLTELLKELRAPALEPLLAHLGQVKNASAKAVLQNAADRIARGHVDALIGILRNRSSPGLIGAVELCQRVNLPPALAPLGDLVGHPDPEVRRAAVTTLGAVGTPGAISLLERGLDDPDRGVRLAAVSVIGERGFKGALKRLEAVVSGKGPHELERAEKRQFFEAFASVAGPNGLETLADILEPKGLFRRKESPETRTCAAYAVARIRTVKARELLERVSHDKELSVRNAASRALREWDE
ncbi:MAG: HEAT repeat domain-containing protein [Gemmatimonadales bacterium]